MPAMYPIPSPFTKPVPVWRQGPDEERRRAEELAVMRRIGEARAAQRIRLPLMRVKPRWKRCEADDLPASLRRLVALRGSRGGMRHGHAGEATVLVFDGVRAWARGRSWNGATIDGSWCRTVGEAVAALDG